METHEETFKRGYPVLYCPGNDSKKDLPDFLVLFCLSLPCRFSLPYSLSNSCIFVLLRSLLLPFF